jgi:3-oxoacyl-[acyl-carrier-protein] synthase-1
VNSYPAAITWLSKQDREVCICGIGGRTAVGLNAVASAAAVRGGLSGIAAHPFYVDKDGHPINLAYDTELPLQLDVHRRMESLLTSALAEALETCPRYDELSPHCWIGIAEARPGIPRSIGQSISTVVTDVLSIPHTSVHALQQGHAGGLMALQACAQNISKGNVDCAVAAGVDSYCDPHTLEWLDDAGCLLSVGNRNGFPPGEAAGVCFLATSDVAEQLGLPVLATLLAASTVVEAHPIRSSEVCVGEGLAAAIDGVVKASCLPERSITLTYCDLNGERYRNEEFAYALLRVQRAFVNVHNYVSPADCWGDVGAASGPLFASLAVVAQQRGYGNGVYSLLWAGSESGHRTAMLLRLMAH